MKILHLLLLLMIGLPLKAADIEQEGQIDIKAEPIEEIAAEEVQSPISSLLALPTEMQKEIMKKITDPVDIVALKITNKALAHFINNMIIEKKELNPIVLWKISSVNPQIQDRWKFVQNFH